MKIIYVYNTKTCEVRYDNLSFLLLMTVIIFFRLWGDNGQSALESAQVCLINATGIGTEILKSLVLPGIGAFTVVDGKKVTEEDIGCKLVETAMLISFDSSNRCNKIFYKIGTVKIQFNMHICDMIINTK